MNLLLRTKVLACSAMLLGMVVAVNYLLASPRVMLLESTGTAHWIKAAKPFDPAKFDFDTTSWFQTSIDLHSQCTLQVSALRRVEIALDGVVFFDSGPNLDRWKTTYSVPLPQALGKHQLRFMVENRKGPSLLRAECSAIGLRSDRTWLAGTDARDWAPASLALDIADPRLPPQFRSTWLDLLRLLPAWGGIFIAAFLFCFFRVLHGSVLRWILLGGWLLLAINNISKVPLQFGYDADSHYLYIHYVADHLSLPRPDAGWQYFQAPLYYIVSGIFQRLMTMAGVADRSIPYLLRLVPLACGGVMIEICFRVAHLVFPDRSDLQAIATLVGGLAPVNIYMAQAVSNEPLAAAVSGWITLIGLKMLLRKQPIRLGNAVLAGMALGVGLLTKVSLILWGIPLSVAFGVSLFRENASLTRWAKQISTVIAITFCVSGPWVMRNLLLVRKPFFLESTVSKEQWWQDPGYRTPRMFYGFGHVFARPIYNGLFSVWDSLYGTLWGNGIPTGQPPWNYGLMSCGLWLALVPTIAMLIGTIRAVFLKSDILWFAALASGVFLTAIFYVYLTLPIYSCAKASYLMGTMPCLGLLAAAGCEPLMARRWIAAGLKAAAICWAATAYLTYFVW